VIQVTNIREDIEKILRDNGVRSRDPEKLKKDLYTLFKGEINTRLLKTIKNFTDIPGLVHHYDSRHITNANRTRNTTKQRRNIQKNNRGTNL
jgi:hypothetical protein